MTPDQAALILHRLNELHSDLVDVKRELSDDVSEVKQLATQTNGRVRQLELWRAKIEGAQAAVGKVPVLVATVASLSSIAALVVTLTH